MILEIGEVTDKSIVSCFFLTHRVHSASLPCACVYWSIIVSNTVAFEGLSIAMIIVVL